MTWRCIFCSTISVLYMKSHMHAMPLPVIPLTVCDVSRFTYQLLQGYDFLHMSRAHNVRVQASTASFP